MMVKVIIDSITKIVRQKLTNQESSITFGAPPLRSVNLILKLIMNNTIIDTRVTSTAFRVDLSNLDSSLSSYSSNIETFNTNVNHTVNSLQARGERVNALITILFKGYKFTSDIKYVSSIDLWEIN